MKTAAPIPPRTKRVALTTVHMTKKCPPCLLTRRREILMVPMSVQYTVPATESKTMPAGSDRPEETSFHSEPSDWQRLRLFIFLSVQYNISSSESYARPYGSL